MFTYFKTQKLRILTILAGLIYVFIVISSFIDGWDDFRLGFEHGAQSFDEHSQAQSKQATTSTSYFLTLKPVDGYLSFPDTLMNNLNHKSIKARFQKVHVLVPDEVPSVSAEWYRAICFILVIIIAINYIIIPFHFFQFMSLIKQNIFFESENIRLLRWFGGELLLVYLGMTLFSYMSFKLNASIFSFSEYEFSMESIDSIWLLFGIVILIIAEILSQARILKEEQELTI